MQDRYAGDVGDFGKFALLKFLFDNANNKIGVIWYRFPNESHNNDGGHIEYVNDSKFYSCDKDLCHKLSVVLFCGRSIFSLENAKLLSANTVYFSDPIDSHLKFPSQKQIDKEGRNSSRKEWLRKAINKIADCNVIFLDPDNGLEIASCSKIYQLKSGKFAYYSEINDLLKGQTTGVIYHHLNRHKLHGPHEEQIRRKVGELRKCINPSGKIFGLRFRPYSPRAYFIITTKKDESRIRKKIDDFMQKSSYGQFWDCYYEEY